MKLSKREARVRRHNRVRSVLSGSAERPRISIFRSNRHLSAQLIDDDNGRTILAVSSVTKETKSVGKNCCNRATAEKLGRELGEKMKAQGIGSAVFDRSGFIYHGIIKAFADAVRSVDGENHFNF